VIRLHRIPSIDFGRGAIERVGSRVRGARERDIRRALLVTTRGMPGRPADAALRASLGAAGVEVVVYDGTPAEPGEAELAEVLTLARERPVDAVVGFGGGSAFDLAKLAAVLAADGRPIGELYGIGRVGRRGLPTVMVPTTAGSGSEVSQDAVLTDRAAGTKRGVKDPALVPDAAVVDPAATDTCPPEVTAASGLDALCHAVEAWTGKRSNPVCDLYAERAVRLIRRHLAAAVTGGSPAARDGMAEAALLSGLAFSPVGTGAVHACGYPLSGVWGVSHGLANSLVLPAVLDFNGPSIGPELARLEEIFETDDVPEALRELARGAGAPTRLRDVGVERTSIPRMATIAAGDERHLAANRRPMDTRDLESVFSAAW
jgi:alcohol dehydrogenase class IV